jgi:hypothetical protein
MNDVDIRRREIRRSERVAVAVHDESVIARRGEELAQQLPREAAVSSTVRETRSVDADAHR